MNPSASFESLAGQIVPAVFCRYLEDTGWVPFRTSREDIAVLQFFFRDGTFAQVTIPRDPGLWDYSRALSTAVRDAADAEGRPMEHLLLTLLHPASDLVRIRVDDPDANQGSVPFEAALALYENAGNLILACVRDVLRREDCPENALDRSAREFVRRCRLGLTEAGGDTVPLVCPFLDPDGIPYGPLSVFDHAGECAGSLTRKVTRHLIQGLHAIQAALDTGNAGTGTAGDVPVSAGFCEAVAGLFGPRREAQVDFQVHWSPAVRANLPAFSGVTLRSPDPASIRAMARRL